MTVARVVRTGETTRDYCERTGDDWSHVEWDDPARPGIEPRWTRSPSRVGSAHTHDVDEPDLREHLRSNSDSLPWVTHRCTVVHGHWKDEA